MAAGKTGSRDLASDRGSLAEWWLSGRLLFRLQATLLGLLTFSAAAVPRLLPALWGLLAVLAAIHVFLIEPKRPLALLRTPIGIALGVFVAYLLINATWAPDRPASLAKAAAVVGASGRRVPDRRVLLLMRGRRRARACQVGFDRPHTRSGVPSGRDCLRRADHALR
jgi:energy-coupling factor transporter transmembrane protein EcfT